MRDIAVVVFLIGCIGLTFWRPWCGVLVLAVFSYLNPHSYAWTWARTLPVYQIAFIAVALSFLTAKDKQPIPRDWRVYTFFMLWLYFLFTTYFAKVPWAAWPKLEFVSKIYLPFLFTLWLINTREKLWYLIITIAASIGLIAAKGGIWAIGTGFNHRVYGPEGTQFSDNNYFAIATLIAIPMLILWRRETTRTWIRYALTAGIPLCFASAVSSWSRGALLTIAVLGTVLIWHSRRKYLAIPLIFAGAYVLYGQLPDEWFARMDTIQTYEQESSARERFQAWEDGFNYALQHPITGAGFEGWRYVTISDWHSSYIEIMAEHGLIAFAMWFSLLVGSIYTLTKLPLQTRRHPELKWVTNWCTMLRASFISYSVGTLFLGLSYWDIFYHLVFITVLVRKFAMEELAEVEARARPERRGPASLPRYGPAPARLPGVDSGRSSPAS